MNKDFDEKTFLNINLNAIKKNCEPGDIHCRRKQRQAILQWAYNPYI